MLGAALIDKLCATGDVPPAVAENDREPGLTFSVFVAAEIVSVTGTLWLFSPTRIVTVPLKVPAANPDGFAVTVNVWGVVRLPEGETESQVRPPLVPEALTPILTVLVAVTDNDPRMDLVLPAVAVNENEVGERVRELPPS